MKKIHIKLLLVLMLPLFYLSCSREIDDNLDRLEKFVLDNPQANAQVKFINAYTALTINTLSTSLATTGTGFRITMDGNKINGAQNNSTSTNTLRYGGQPDTVTYSSSFFPTTNTYAFVSPGLRTFKFTMNRIVSGNYAPTAADDVFTSTQTIVAGKKYSMFIADPYGPPGVLMTQDNFKEPNKETYGVRFVNVCADAATRFDVVSKRYGSKIFSNIGYKEMTDFIYLSTTTRDTIYLYNAANNSLISQINGFLPVPQRVYTFYARGKTGVTGRTPTINFYTNR